MNQSNPESNNTNSPDSDDSIEAIISSHSQSIDKLLSDSDADSETIEAVEEQINELFERLSSHFNEQIKQDQQEREELRNQFEENDQRLKQLEEEYVPSVAVESVLLEYGINPDAADSIVDDIEAVHDSMRSDSDE